MQDNVVFNEALQCGSTFIDKVLGCNVYPADEALDNLE